MLSVEEREELLNDIAIKKPWKQIAADNGISIQTIANYKRYNKEIIEQKTQELIGLLPQVTDIVQEDINQHKLVTDKIVNKVLDPNVDSLTKEEANLVNALLDLKKQGNKTVENILKAIGFYPTQSQSLMIQNIYNDNRKQTVISDRYLKYLDTQIDNDTEIIEEVKT